MHFRIATLLLVLLTIGFFIFHKINQDSEGATIWATINPIPIGEPKIAQDEFLILMDQGDEKFLSDVLNDFDLKLIAPLGEWLHVAKRESMPKPMIIPLSSKKAAQNLALVAQIEAHEAVHSAHLNHIQNIDPMFLSATEFIGNDDKKITVMPRDPYFRYQWYLSKDQGIDLPGAWAITMGSSNTVIAIVDRNFDFSDSDLAPSRCPSRQYFFEDLLEYFPNQVISNNQDEMPHGAYVLSVLAPCTNNNVGLAGIDWHAQIFNVDSKSDASLSMRMFAMLWAAGIDVCENGLFKCPKEFRERYQKNFHPANVMNTSFGFAGAYLTDPPYGPVLDVIGRINREGSIIVASTGNEGSLADRRLPGAAGGVISVGASNEKKQSSVFSNFGRTVDVLAPGENILGRYKGNVFLLNGTSFSAPIVAGVVSLMQAVAPALSFKQAEYILKQSATPLLCSDYCPNDQEAAMHNLCQNYCCKNGQQICAKGIVNAKNAVIKAGEGIPDLALVDIDDYYIALSDDNNFRARVVVKNWGKRAGIVRMKAMDPNIKMVPNTFVMASMDSRGAPGSKEITIIYDAIVDSPVISNFILEIANQDHPNNFHDQIEAIVEIVPDANTKRVKRWLDLPTQ